MSERADDERGLFPSSVGAQLAAERVRQKLELSDIAARTRIPLRHLEAIETGNHSGLPAIPYSAGFVKSYAVLLGLDGQAVSRAFRAEIGDERRAAFEPEAYEPVDPSRVPTRLLAMIALGVALLLGMAYLLLRFEGDNSELAKLAADTAQDIRPVPKPAPRPVAPPAPAVPTGPISIVAIEDIWMKVTDGATGDVLFKEVLKAGQSYAVPETAADPSLRILKPQLVKVLIGTTELPPLAEPDVLVPAYSLKRDALVAIAMAPKAEPVAVPPDPLANSATTDLRGQPLPPPAGVAPPAGPRRERRLPVGADPAGSRPDISGVATDPGQRP